MDIYKCPKCESGFKNPKKPRFFQFLTIMLSFSEKCEKSCYDKFFVFFWVGIVYLDEKVPQISKSSTSKYYKNIK
jgi:hypothetical protein